MPQPIGCSRIPLRVVTAAILHHEVAKKSCTGAFVCSLKKHVGVHPASLERRWRRWRWWDVFFDAGGVFADECAAILHQVAARAAAVEPVDIVIKAALAGLWLAER